MKNGDYRRIAANSFSLIVLNAINVLFPLITVPYLIYVLGISSFGTVSFALVIAQYINMLGDYGFALTATQKISIHSNNAKKVNTIFWSSTFIRITLSVGAFLVFAVLVFIIPKLAADKLLYLYIFGIVLGNSLIPVWLFQGFERMKYLTIINLITKGVFTLLIFIVIKKETHYEYVTLLSSIGFLFSGIFSMILSIRLFKLRFEIPTYARLWHELKEGWHVFLSIISMSFYRNSNVFVLGVMTSDIYVGYYAAAEKVIKAVQAMITPISTALFPYMSKRFGGGTLQQNVLVIGNISKYYLVILLPISLFITIFAHQLVFILGEKYLSSIIDLQIMGFVVFLGGLNYLLGIIGLINMGYKKEFTRFVMISGIFSVIITVVFSPFFYDKAAAFSLVFSEGLLFSLLLIFLVRIKHI